MDEARLLLGLEVVEEDAALLGLLTPVLDDNARAVDDLAGVALTVNLAETSPLAELLAIRDLDERNLVLGAQGNDELLVRLLLAGLVENAHVRLATVEGLGRLAQTAGKSVVDEGELENALERLEHAHLALTAGCIGRDLDLGGRADLGLGIVFSVRHDV
jgi:hypothetical protein